MTVFAQELYQPLIGLRRLNWRAEVSCPVLSGSAGAGGSASFGSGLPCTGLSKVARDTLVRVRYGAGAGANAAGTPSCLT